MTERLMRHARSTDAGKAGAILSEFVEDTAWMPRIHTGAEDIGFVGSMIEKGWVTVAMQGDQFAGFLACDVDEVHALYIHRSAWRQGCGAALLRHAQDVSKNSRFGPFRLTSMHRRFIWLMGLPKWSVQMVMVMMNTCLTSVLNGKRRRHNVQRARLNQT